MTARLVLRNSAGEVVAYALIDAADEEWLSQWRWHMDDERGYVARKEGRRGNQRKVYLHRQILGLKRGDPRMGEHRNRNRLDNRRANLRIAVRGDLDNKQNLDPYSTNTSGYRGVTRRGSGWVAQCTVNYKNHYLGYYQTPEEADYVVRAFRAKHMPFSEEASG
jgi:hypothetical protein